MNKWIIAVTLLMLAGTPANAGGVFDEQGSFSFREMLKSFAALFSPPKPEAREKSVLPVNLPPAAAKEWLETEKPSLIDIRTPEEFAQGRLAGAQLMDFYAPDFAEKLGKLDKNAKYLIYCRSGRRSASALETMSALGFREARDIAGGINAWSAAGYPVLR